MPSAGNIWIAISAWTCLYIDFKGGYNSIFSHNLLSIRDSSQDCSIFELHKGVWYINCLAFVEYAYASFWHVSGKIIKGSHCFSVNLGWEA